MERLFRLRTNILQRPGRGQSAQSGANAPPPGTRPDHPLHTAPTPAGRRSDRDGSATLSTGPSATGGARAGSLGGEGGAGRDEPCDDPARRPETGRLTIRTGHGGSDPQADLDTGSRELAPARSDGGGEAGSGALAPLAAGAPRATASKGLLSLRNAAAAGHPDAPSRGLVPVSQEGDAGQMPAFRMPPGGRRANTEEDAETRDAAAELIRAFTPTQPKNTPQLFAGRRRQIERVIAAIEEERASVVLYGERGMGKTSLSNVVADAARKVGYLVVRHTCNSGTDYSDVFRSLFAAIPGRFLSGSRAVRSDGERVATLADLLPPASFGVTEVIDVVRAISDGHVILILDEFDRITEPAIRSRVAETIKALADLLCPVTFLILGAAERVEALLGTDASVQRNVVGVRLPLMTPEELNAAIDIGTDASGIQFPPDVRRAIAAMSGGMPYALQLLCLYSGRAAIRRGTTIVDFEDIEIALRRALDEVDRSVADIYQRATRSNSSATMCDAALAAATAHWDAFGRFGVAEAAAALAVLKGEEMHPLTLGRALARLTTEAYGAMLDREVTPTGDVLFRFRNQMTRLFVFSQEAQVRLQL